MPRDYVYDIFISYRREPPVLDWVRNHFYPLLDQWLPNFTPVTQRPKIFIDWQIETGAKWPAALKNALKVSRCLIPVWTPEYFRSEWCVAEWKTMIKREQLCRRGTTQNPLGLIYPVIFSDGEHFPTGALDTQHKDLREWNYQYPVFRETAGYLAFDRAIQQLSQELANFIQRAPTWRDWPVVTPRPTRTVTVRIPRL